MASPQIEEDFPKGHPARFDYDPHSPEAIEWARKNVAPLGQRDFPVDHPKAADTPGNTNHLQWQAGVDPHNPHREAHTGRTPAQAAGVAALTETASKAAQESPVLQPLDASIVNAALDERRRQLNRDLLTPEEYSDVVARVRAATADPVSEADVKARIEKQHQALQVLLGRGYTRATALEVIAREGADKFLQQPATGQS